MKALIHGQRHASLRLALGLLGLCCLLGASVGLNIKHHADLDRLQHLIYTRCTQLTGPQNDARRVEVAEWTALAEQERHNPFIDESLRAQRVASYQRLADAMQAAVDASARNSCAQYR